MAQVVEHRDLSYLPSGTPPNAFQTFDVYIPREGAARPSDPAPLICFIHGGAWRAEDKSDHASLARTLAVSTGCPVALPNYRLTPREPTPDDSPDALRHPAHAQDVLRFLEYILSWHTGNGNGGRLPRKPSMLFLVGHSCSAHMLSTLFLRMPGDPDDVCPSDELVLSTAAVIMSEGIYDIDLLLASFPGYRTWFIENAFGKRDTFENVSAFKATVRPNTLHISWLIIHSKGDTLVDERQSAGMYDFLKERSYLVSKSFDTLEDPHNDILQTPQYVGLIDGYIKDILARGDPSRVERSRA